MSESITAKRYAEALFQLGQEHDTLNDMVADLQAVTDIFHKHERIYTYLDHPRVKYAEKKQFLTETFKDLQPMILHTILILVAHDHAEIIPSITAQFIQKVNEDKGVGVAQVYSVRKLSDSETQSLADNFAKRFNKKTIQIENVIDSTVLGGLKIRIGNTVFDGSIKGKLARLERDIVTENK